MIQILRKEGWELNPNDKVVNAILRRCEANNGECPCHNTGKDKRCPCSDYRENDVCHCSLYIKREQLIPSIDLSKIPSGMDIEAFVKAWQTAQESPLIVVEGVPQ
ncbi:hypothetical protein [uncultured Clostridium sp.]|jgi:ferredoxin-thioredoxin reductase catalytic subunit|uniref:Ferredoxin-thioredoxin reductase n=1 Tax=Kehishuvirus sp. 'tikkala' TaxID=3028513 RepID=A0AAF0D5L6_9CAUD|nr:hypothetical protein [uncultured Clostridium sp.]WEU69833.1 putative ferredoxin-thioredoxin reductase [Kehishuvirus sp. 'tikkala']